MIVMCISWPSPDKVTGFWDANDMAVKGVGCIIYSWQIMKGACKQDKISFMQE